MEGSGSSSRVGHLAITMRAGDGVTVDVPPGEVFFRFVRMEGIQTIKVRVTAPPTFEILRELGRVRIPDTVVLKPGDGILVVSPTKEEVLFFFARMFNAAAIRTSITAPLDFRINRVPRRA